MTASGETGNSFIVQNQGSILCTNSIGNCIKDNEIDITKLCAS